MSKFIISDRRVEYNIRKCCGCFKNKNLSELQRCSKCFVCVYCNRDCQLKHWKTYGHKNVCRPYHPRAPPFLGIDRTVVDDSDLDALFSCIIVYPSELGTTRKAFYDCVQGVEIDADLANLAYTGTPLGLDNTTSRRICSKFNWPSQFIGYAPVVGFSQEFDGIRMNAYFDDSFSTCVDLQYNLAATYLMMRNLDEGIKGSVVLIALDEDNNIVKLSRSEILSFIEHNNEAGTIGAVTERVHFENMKRSSTLSFLKSSNSQFVQL